MIIHYQTGTTRHKKQLQLVLWLLNGNWTGATDYVFWNAASKNNNNISQLLAWELQSFSPPNWKLRDGSPLPSPPPPHHTSGRHVCTAAAPSFRVSLTVKTCLVLFLVTDSILLYGFGSHSHLRSSHAFGFNALRFMHFDFKGDPHSSINPRAPHMFL